MTAATRYRVRIDLTGLSDDDEECSDDQTDPNPYTRYCNDDDGGDPADRARVVGLYGVDGDDLDVWDVEAADEEEARAIVGRLLAPHPGASVYAVEARP